MYIPSFCIDSCQLRNGNQTSWNKLIVDKKLLRINDEIILSTEFTPDEMLEIQYKMGNLYDYLFNRKKYHHPASTGLLLNDARNINLSLVNKHKNQRTARIVYIYKSGNVLLEFSKDDDKSVAGNIKIVTVSPLIIERVSYDRNEGLLYAQNKKYINKGQWMDR